MAGSGWGLGDEHGPSGHLQPRASTTSGNVTSLSSACSVELQDPQLAQLADGAGGHADVAAHVQVLQLSTLPSNAVCGVKNASVWPTQGSSKKGHRTTHAWQRCSLLRCVI